MSVNSPNTESRWNVRGKKDRPTYQHVVPTRTREQDRVVYNILTQRGPTPGVCPKLEESAPECPSELHEIKREGKTQRRRGQRLEVVPTVKHEERKRSRMSAQDRIGI